MHVLRETRLLLTRHLDYADVTSDVPSLSKCLEIERADRDRCLRHLRRVADVFRTFKNTSNLPSLRDALVSDGLLPICAMLHHFHWSEPLDVLPHTTQLLDDLLDLVVQSATNQWAMGQFLVHTGSLDEWTLGAASSDWHWLVAFLEDLRSREASIGDDSTSRWYSMTDAFLTWSHMDEIKQHSSLLAALDSILAMDPPTSATSPLSHLQIATLRAIPILACRPHSGSISSNPLTPSIQWLQDLVEQPSGSLSNSADMDHLYVRDKIFVDILLSLESSSHRDTWLNSPQNHAYLQSWLCIVDRWLAPAPESWDDLWSRVDELSIGSLVTCERLYLAAGSTDWGSDLACVQRVAVMAVWHLWYGRSRYSADAPAEPARLIQRTLQVMTSLDIRNASDVVWCLARIPIYMRKVRTNVPLGEVDTVVRKKLREVRALNTRGTLPTPSNGAIEDAGAGTPP